MNALEHVKEQVPNVNPLTDIESDPMSIRSMFAKAANAVIDASTLRQEVQGLRDDVQGLRDTVNTLLKERDQAIRERDEARTEAERIHVVYEDTKRRHKSELDALHETLERRAVSVEALEGERDALRTDMDTLTIERNVLRSDLEQKHSVLMHTQAILTDAERLFELTKRERDDWQLKSWTAEEEVRRQSELVGKFNSQVNDLERSLSETRQHVESLRAEVAEWRHGAELARDDHKRASDKLIEINDILVR